MSHEPKRQRLGADGTPSDAAGATASEALRPPADAADFSCGHRFGNFANYYNFHSCDERLGELPLEIFLSAGESSTSAPVDRYILDVGCNEGNLSVRLLNMLQAEVPSATWHLLGVDLDPILVERARLKFTDLKNSTFECIDVTSDDFTTFKESFFATHKITGFDFVCCFSTTMWVHLNHGDAGLQNFLSRIGSACRSYLILEPQKWKSYKSAVERCRRRGMTKFPLFEKLKWRGVDIDDCIIKHMRENEGFELQKKSSCDEMAVAGNLTYWGRSVMIMKKQS